jgi:hypothetical protein
LSIFYPFKKKKILNTFVTKNNINELIYNFYSKNEEIDCISIDVDGNDYFLMEAINFMPKLIIIEYNFWLGKEESVTMPYQEDYSWDGNIYCGHRRRSPQLIALYESMSLHTFANNSRGDIFNDLLLGRPAYRSGDRNATLVTDPDKLKGWARLTGRDLVTGLRIIKETAIKKYRL